MTLCPVSRYAERPPPPRLDRFVKCAWTTGPPDPASEPVLPDGSIDIIWDGVRLFVAGPDTGPKSDTGRGPIALGVRFRPGAGPFFLGSPAELLKDARVDLEHFWEEATTLAGRLGEIEAPFEGCRLIESAVAARLHLAPAPDRLVEEAVRHWSQPPAGAGRLELDRLSGLSDRQVHRRFVTAVGYGPKKLQSILRFQSFLHLSAKRRLPLAELAQLCGYFDQSHLSRETARLSRRTPAVLQRARLDVRNIQDIGRASPLG